MAETTQKTMLPLPDAAWVPEPLRGRHIAQIHIAYLGAAEEGSQLVEPLRARGPLRETLRDLPFSQSRLVFDEPDQPGAYRGTGLLLDAIDAGALSALAQRAGPSASAMCVVGMRHLGGALARAPRVPSAIGHRGAAFAAGVLSPMQPGGQEGVGALHRRVLEPVRDVTVGRSLNFTFGPLQEQQVRAAFDEQDYARLRRLKARYDPGSLLHCNHPIPPEAGGGAS